MQKSTIEPKRLRLKYAEKTLQTLLKDAATRASDAAFVQRCVMQIRSNYLGQWDSDDVSTGASFCFLPFHRSLFFSPLTVFDLAVDVLLACRESACIDDVCSLLLHMHNSFDEIVPEQSMMRVGKMLPTMLRDDAYSQCHRFHEFAACVMSAAQLNERSKIAAAVYKSAHKALFWCACLLRVVDSHIFCSENSQVREGALALMVLCMNHSTRDTMGILTHMSGDNDNRVRAAALRHMRHVFMAAKPSTSVVR